jgi:hypothetical protein
MKQFKYYSGHDPKVIECSAFPGDLLLYEKQHNKITVSFLGNITRRPIKSLSTII